MSERREYRAEPARDGERAIVSDVEYDKRYFKIDYVNPGSENERAKLIVELNRDIPPGGFDKTVVVHFADNAANKHVMQLVGWVERNIEIKPPELNFGVVQDGSATRATLTLYSPYGKPIRFVRIETDSNHKLTITKVAARNGGQECDIDIDLDSRTVRSLEVFPVRVIGESQGTEYTIPVNCYVGTLEPSNAGADLLGTQNATTAEHRSR
jgi:hypothetical protein